MFALHVNSDFPWMSSTLLDLCTKGSLKTLTMATSLGAVISLPLVLRPAWWPRPCELRQVRWAAREPIGRHAGQLLAADRFGCRR